MSPITSSFEYENEYEREYERLKNKRIEDKAAKKRFKRSSTYKALEQRTRTRRNSLRIK